jgi:hypothetical protein
MTLKRLKPPRPLRPFRSFLPDRFRRKRPAVRLPGKLNEETMQGIIKGGSAIVIGNKTTENERAAAIDGFVDDISNMEGEKIFALAVAFD